MARDTKTVTCDRPIKMRAMQPLTYLNHYIKEGQVYLYYDLKLPPADVAVPYDERSVAPAGEFGGAAPPWTSQGQVSVMASKPEVLPELE